MGAALLVKFRIGKPVNNQAQNQNKGDGMAYNRNGKGC